MYKANIYKYVYQNYYLNEGMPIMCFYPPNSPFFVKIFFMFEEKPVGNLILWMTSFTSFLCCSVNKNGRLFWSSTPSDLFEYRITLWIAWLTSWMSVQILTIFSLSLLPSMIHHNVSITFFPICIVSKKWDIFISS